MKISFVDFWGDFLNNNNFFYHLMREITENVIVTSPDDCDILFCGCFYAEHHKFKTKKIYYSSEGWDYPNMDLYDFSITGEKFSDKNIKIPHWMMYIDWFNVGGYNNPQYLIPIDYFFHDNEFTKIEKNKFASWVFNNKVSDRMITIENLKKYKHIELFGGAGEYIPYGEYNKLKVISNYKFNFCYENTIREGYHTEKLIHAKASGCIPIYKSHESSNQFFNEESFINVKNLSENEIIDKIIEIDTDVVKYSKMLSQPLFIERPNLDEIKNDMYKKLF